MNTYVNPAELGTNQRKISCLSCCWKKLVFLVFSIFHATRSTDICTDTLTTKVYTQEVNVVTAIAQRKALWSAENEALPQCKALWSAEPQRNLKFSYLSFIFRLVYLNGNNTAEGRTILNLYASSYQEPCSYPMN